MMTKDKRVRAIRNNTINCLKTFDESKETNLLIYFNANYND